MTALGRLLTFVLLFLILIPSAYAQNPTPAYTYHLIPGDGVVATAANALGDASGAVYLPLPNGTDDTSTIQAAINALPTYLVREL